MNHARCLQIIASVSILVLAGAFAFQHAGYLPCELCYIGRWAHFAAIPLGLGFSLIPEWRRAGLYLLGAIFIANMAFSFWHAGIEWHWWPGPTACTGGGGLSGGLPDFNNLNVVQCDTPAIRIFGLSLAGWNAVISGALAGLAFRQGSSSVSQ